MNIPFLNGGKSRFEDRNRIAIMLQRRNNADGRHGGWGERVSLKCKRGKSASAIHPFLAHSRSLPIPCQHHLAPFLLTLTLIEGQQPLAQSDALWRHFDQFIIADILDSIVEAQDARRFQPDPFFRRRRTDVGQMLATTDIHLQVTLADVLSDDHTLVDLGAGRDKERAALLRLVEGGGL
jgi:hypothetical protein